MYCQWLKRWAEHIHKRLTKVALPAKGSMCSFHAAAAASGLMFACDAISTTISSHSNYERETVLMLTRFVEAKKIFGAGIKGSLSF